MLGKETRIQPPILDAFSDLPLYNTKAVVHQTGVPAPTLRAWERRYGILSPRRAENDYRLYSERDIMLVLWLREQVEIGLTISQAIALLRSTEPARRRSRRSRPLSHVVESPDGGPEQPVAGLAIADLRSALLNAFITLDEQAVNQVITQAIAIYPVEEVCLSLIAETLQEVGKRWAEGQLTVTCEHFASAALRAQLESLFRSAPCPAEGPLALVGCAPGEMHELGSLILALLLRRGGVRVTFLGQSVEADDLLATIGAVRPACVALSASLLPSAHALVEFGGRLAHARKPAPLFFFGGHAFEDRPELIERVPGQFVGDDMRQAVLTIKKRITTSC
ncbi:MAG TPA: cobalamin-dependent protein [Ktedonobacterales bacterium]